jgi:hypothetical protein
MPQSDGSQQGELQLRERNGGLPREHGRSTRQTLSRVWCSDEFCHGQPQIVEAEGFSTDGAHASTKETLPDPAWTRVTS